MGDYDAVAATQIRAIFGFVAFVLLVTFMGRWKRVFLAAVDKEGMKGITVGAIFGPFVGVALSLLRGTTHRDRYRFCADGADAHLHYPAFGHHVQRKDHRPSGDRRGDQHRRSDHFLFVGNFIQQRWFFFPCCSGMRVQ